MTAPLQTVQALNDALEILENTLEPLFEKALSETMDTHDKLEQAKLCAMIPYIVNQLIITYLRTRGINPSTHPVDAEVNRIKSYFHKIAKAAEPDKPVLRESEQHLQLDKAAADRFIKAALAEVTRGAQMELSLPDNNNVPGLPPQEQKPSPPKRLDAQPLKDDRVYSRFQRAADDSDENEGSSDSISGNELEPAEATKPDTEKKRKRPVMDPFAGYMEPASKKPKKKSRSKNKPSEPVLAKEADEEMAPPINEKLVEGSSKSTKARKKSKKKNQSQE